MEIQGIAEWANKCIEGCIAELSALTTRVHDGIEPHRLALICDCEDDNGFAKIITVLEMAFRHSVSVNMLNNEGSDLLYKLDEAWDAFLGAIESKISNRKCYTDLRTAIKKLRVLLRKAYCGKHVDDEAVCVRDLRNALANLSQYFASLKTEEARDAHVTAEANRVIATLKGTPKTREEVVAFVRSLYDKSNPKLMSLPKVVGYIRSLKDSDDPNFAQCAEVRVLVQGLAKKVKGGVDAAWRSIAQEAKLSHGKKKSTGVPGLVPILYRGSDFL